MKAIDAIQFMTQMNKDLKKSSFDQLFLDPNFGDNFSSFIRSRIGLIWLKKPQGAAYTRWQKS